MQIVDLVMLVLFLTGGVYCLFYPELYWRHY